MTGEGVSLKVCKACMLARYCSPACQKKHWPEHKKDCKQRAAELRDEALFKDPPAKEECPICFLPIPFQLLSCMTLPPATIMSVPIHDFAIANEALVNMNMETAQYYTCCGKRVCHGCTYSFIMSGNFDKCPFCNSEFMGKTCEKRVQDMMKRVDANDAGAMCQLGCYYYNGNGSLQQDREKALELYARAAKLGSSQAHFLLGCNHHEWGDLKWAKFHYEAAAMAGHVVARNNLGTMEAQSGDWERAVKHWIIAASSGAYNAMKNLIVNIGYVSRESIDSTLIAYNNSCVEMRSEARDKYISKYKG